MTIDDRQLMRLLDGDLDDQAAAELEARLESEPDARAKLQGLRAVGTVLREIVAEDNRGASIADAVIAKIGDDEGRLVEPPASGKVSALTRTATPANDNARSIYALAGVAAAVAAGLFLWGRADTEPTALTLPAVEEPAPEVARAAPSQPATEPDAPQDEGDAEPAVEIASVDFGAQSGSVFYISGNKAAASTAVVWVTDPGE